MAEAVHDATGPHRAPRPVAADARALGGRDHPPRPARPRERRAHWPSSTPRATRTPRGLAVTADLHPAPVSRRPAPARAPGGEPRRERRRPQPPGRARVGHHLHAATGAASSRSSTTATCSTPPCCRPLLEPFQRIDRGARGDGAGLGLSIVRSVAQAHGGAVALAVCPDGGLRATVTLPRGEPARAHPTRPLLSGACPCLSADPSCAVRPTWPP